MEGVVKKFSTDQHRRMYTRLHKKTCNIIAVSKEPLRIETTTGHLFQNIKIKLNWI
jgi:anti-sigma factor ChrR (cupin superfamily)